MAIVKSHSGIINVSSEPSKGTSFQVYLPALIEAQEERMIAESSTELSR